MNRCVETSAINLWVCSYTFSCERISFPPVRSLWTGTSRIYFPVCYCTRSWLLYLRHQIVQDSPKVCCLALSGTPGIGSSVPLHGEGPIHHNSFRHQLCALSAVTRSNIFFHPEPKLHSSQPHFQKARQKPLKKMKRHKVCLD